MRLPWLLARLSLGCLLRGNLLRLWLPWLLTRLRGLRELLRRWIGS